MAAQVPLLRPGDDGGDDRAERPRRDFARPAAIVFFGVVAAAIPLYLILGDQQSFFLDEWDFLADRDARSLDDLLRPHNEHWTTIPIVVYRILWRFVGLRSYVPYQVVIIALHLTAATLLWIVMRRACVRPYVATAAAGAFVLFGAGRDNIVWAFQIAFVGALVCGLAHLLLADHDGPLDRRDGFGIAFGLAGLMCSGIGVTMVVIVGIAVLLRRGWRAALVHTAPLGCVYLAWYLLYGRGAYGLASSDLGQIFEFVTISVSNGFSELGQLPGVGVALGVLLIGGIVLTCLDTPLARLRTRYAATAALLIGALLFTLISAVGRAAVLGPESARAGRYTHLFVAMILPALAVAADAVIQRWRPLAPVVVVLLLIGIPGNIDAVRPRGPDQFLLGTARVAELLAHSPAAQLAPRSFHPFQSTLNGREITVGWLRDGAASGRIPVPANATATERATASLRLSLQQRRTPARAECLRLTAPTDRILRAGESLTFAKGRLAIQLVTDDETVSEPVSYVTAGYARLVALVGPLHLRATPARVGNAEVCG